MLCLSRRIGEKIFIGDNIVITIVDIDRGKIRLGIQCPPEIKILREELLPIVVGGYQPKPDSIKPKLPKGDTAAEKPR